MIENVRGKRYCEIIVAKGRRKNLKATVYTTLGLNECPAESWDKIDFDRLKKDRDAKAVIKNGPRYFLMDKLSGKKTTPRKPTSFQGLMMVDVATLKIKGKSKPYNDRTVNRSTVFTFNKGSMTYQLVGPTGTYVMQSYSQIIDPNLKESDLASLGDSLNLPKGWTFKAVKLEKELKVSTLESGKATVIQDDLSNTYQKIK